MSGNWRTVRVFISSTFRDMQAERDWLVRFVFPKLRELLTKYRIHFVDVDLRWGVTGDQDALGVCREVIDECHPRFMCMLGGRYGWVTDGQDNSITADEIHYGVLGREAEKRGHAFFYFRNDGATARMVEQSPGDFRELVGSDNAKKLAGLKRAVADAGPPVHHYDAQWDAAQKRLTGLEAFGNQVQADLLQSLQDDPELAARFTDEITAPLDEFAEEADQMEAFIEERSQPDRYILGSREPLLRDMLAFAAADGTPNVFVLTGDPGSGKSAFLAKFTREIFQSPITSHQSPLLLPHFIGASTGSTDLRRTLRRLCHELTRAAGSTEPLPLDIKELITHFQKLLAEAAGRQRVILVFDAFNQFDATDGAHWLNWLPPMEKLPPGVRIVASTLVHPVLRVLEGRGDAVRIVRLEPLTEADTLAVIEGYLRRYAKRLSPEQLAALLAKPAGRLPLYVLTALDELRTLGTYEEITARIRELPGDARALFGWILTDRLTRDPGFRDREGRPCGAVLVEKFAACLGVSRHGLSPAELAALLDPGDPLGNVAALLRLLRPYLLRRGELLDFYHGQFREAAGAAHLDTPEKQRAAHQSVATCLQAFADPHCDGQCRDATPHALSELPYHQTRAEAWPDLIATLENIFFLEAKVTHGMAFDLAEDFATAVDALPLEHVERQRLRLLDEALRRDIHFISRHPTTLFQCLWNLGWWYDAPAAAFHYLAEGNDSVRVETPWADPTKKLHGLLERWREAKACHTPEFIWLRALRPAKRQLGSACQLVLSGHEFSVNSIAFSEEQGVIATGSSDKTVRVWDSSSGAELFCLRNHERSVAAVAFSADSRWLATGSTDGTVCIFRAGSFRLFRRFEGLGPSVEDLCFIDSSRIAVCGSDGTLTLLDVLDGQQFFHFQSEAKGRTALASLPGTRGIAFAVGFWSCHIVDADSGGIIKTIKSVERNITCLACAPDGNTLASGGYGGVCLWNATTGQLIRQFERHGDHGVTCLAFSPDGCQIATGSCEGSARILDVESGQEMRRLEHEADWINAVQFSRNGKKLLTATNDGRAYVWGLEKTSHALRLRGDVKGPISARFSTYGRHLLVQAADHTVSIWSVDEGRPLGNLCDDEGRVHWIPFSRETHRDHPYYAELDTGQLLGINFFDCTSDGGIAAAGGLEGFVRLWTIASGRVILCVHAHEDAISSIRFSNDGTMFVSASWDGTLSLWNAQSAKLIHRYRGHAQGVNDAAVSGDGRLLASASSDKTVRVWRVDSGEQVQCLLGHESSVRRVAFMPGGALLISESEDGAVRVWNPSSGACVQSERSDSSWFTALNGKPPTWRLVEGVQEAELKSLPKGEVAGWLPYRDKGWGFPTVRESPNGKTWVAGAFGHLEIFLCESA